MVVSLIFIIQWSLDAGMLDYVNQREAGAMSPMANSLEKAYAKTGSWQLLRDNHRGFRRMIHESLQGTEFEPPPISERHRLPPPGEKDRLHAKEDRAQRPSTAREFGRPPSNGPRGREVDYALLDSSKVPVVGRYSPEREYSFIELTSSNNIIGYLAISKRHRLIEGYELNFVNQQQNYLFSISVALLTLTLLITLPLARHLVHPIRRLAAAMTKLSQGHYKQELAIERKDEFADLSRDFNRLTRTLASNEQARRKWLADISHELRTPVSVLKGELEAILDGVRPLSVNSIKSANEEVNQLQHLIDDLYELTRTDLGTLHYRKSKINLTESIVDSAEKFRVRLSGSGIQLNLTTSIEPIFIYADGKRLKQLISNLLTNVQRYAIGATQTLITIEQSNGRCLVTLEDDGIGVSEEHLDKLFDHLYRIDKSRNRDTGGSGLGLSICRQIVEAHEGSIVAFSSGLGGLGVHIILPSDL